MTRTGLICAGAALLALSACGKKDDSGKAEAQRLARRNSCVAAELALSAKERLASLDTMAANSQGTPLESAANASRAFAAAYKAWADSASMAADLADSAAAAGSADDSTRYAQLSAQARPHPATAGTAQANAAAQYNDDVTRALGNPDHPCNKLDQKDES
jgi:hypothetical protein